MTSLDEFAEGPGIGSWAAPLLNQLRARRDRARLVLNRQAELLARLEASLNANKETYPAGEFAQLRQWMSELSEQQLSWQKRQDENWERQLATLDALAEQIVEIADTVQQGGGAQSPGATAKLASTPAAPASNWEQAKQRLLAELENAPDESAASAEENKPASKGRRPWQQIIAEKDAEIALLRRQLEQAATLPAVELPEFVEQDELVKIERENLRKLQSEWEEKLRRAEIEISLERAKLARERAQVEEKMQSAQRDPNAPANTPAAEDPNKAPRSRWKARLGLLDE